MGILPWSVDEIEGEYLGAVMKLLMVLFLFGALANLHMVRSLPRRPIIKKNNVNVEGRTAGSQILCSENCEAYRDFLTTRHADGSPMATETRGLVKRSLRHFDRDALPDFNPPPVTTEDRVTTENRSLVKRGFFDKVKDLANKAKKAAKKAKDAAKNLAMKAKDAVKDKVDKLIKKKIKEEKKRDKRSLTTGNRSLVKRGFFDKVKDLAKKAKVAAKKTKDAAKKLAKKAKDAVKDKVDKLIKKTIKDKKREKRSLVTTGYRSLVKRGFFDKVKDLAQKTKKAAKRLPPALKNWAKKKAKDAVKSQVNKLKKKKLQGRGRRSTADSRGFSPSSGVQVVRRVIRQGQDNQGIYLRVDALLDRMMLKVRNLLAGLSVALVPPPPTATAVIGQPKRAVNTERPRGLLRP